ncbi:MAG: hypothetical protein R3B69_01560 [Candidatus Paceibacterota bacterium]
MLCLYLLAVGWSQPRWWWCGDSGLATTDITFKLSRLIAWLPPKSLTISFIARFWAAVSVGEAFGERC